MPVGSGGFGLPRLPSSHGWPSGTGIASARRATGSATGNASGEKIVYFRVTGKFKFQTEVSATGTGKLPSHWQVIIQLRGGSLTQRREPLAHSGWHFQLAVASSCHSRCQ